MLIQVKTAPITVGRSSVDVQGQILEHPTETYVTKCDTTLVSPTISVRFFDSVKQQKIDELATPDNYDLDEAIMSKTINVSRSMLNQQNSNSSSFELVCKYHVTLNDTWTADDRVCRTVVSSDEASSVTCLCHQPVTHAVSLDYIQSTTGEAESNSDDSTPCTNPCGCTSQRKTPKLQSWAKALIGVSVSIVIIVMALLLMGVGWIIVKNVFMKRSFSDRVATRVELRNVDSPAMALRFCRYWLC